MANVQKTIAVETYRTLQSVSATVGGAITTTLTATTGTRKLARVTSTMVTYRWTNVQRTITAETRGTL
jgi:hypothetical protein